MDGNGILSIPSNLEELWMSEGELVDMLHVTAPKLNSVIRAIYKEGMLSMSEVQYKDETSVSVWQTLYNFPMIVAICAENGGYPPTQNGDIRSLFWLFSLMALQN